MLASWLPPDYSVIVKPLSCESYVRRHLQGSFAFREQYKFFRSIEKPERPYPRQKSILAEYDEPKESKP